MAKTATKAPAKANSHTYPDTEVDVRILSLRDEGSLRATASANLNGVFAIRNIKVMEGKNGLFVSMPSFKVGDDYKDIAFPVTKDFREKFNAAVLDAYEQRLEQAAKQAENAPGPEQASGMSQSM
jgi:stage V sporulation protein G